jgi:hypothetical protein
MHLSWQVEFLFAAMLSQMPMSWSMFGFMQYGNLYVLVGEGMSALTQTLVVDPEDECVHVRAHVVVGKHVHGQDHDGQHLEGG